MSLLRTPPLPPLVQQLLLVLHDPREALRLDGPVWDRLLRAARSARLLGRVAATLEKRDLLASVPQPVRDLLDGERNRAAYYEQAVRFELACVERALVGIETPIVLLKGAAYVTEGLELARGRALGDVDFMVPRRNLDAVEARLLEQGWKFAKTDPYDQHYYRAWSHELPSMRMPEHALDLDLHHAILPVKGRITPDPDKLFAAARPLAGSRWHALAPADQILHAAAHLFQDGECWNALRDLHDLDQLMRAQLQRDAHFATTLLTRADELGMRRPLGYATRFLDAWFATPLPLEVTARCKPSLMSVPGVALVTWCAARTLPPVDPDAQAGTTQRLARRVLALRAPWLRMPPWLFAYHASRKGLRTLEARRSRRSRDGAGTARTAGAP